MWSKTSLLKVVLLGIFVQLTVQLLPVLLPHPKELDSRFDLMLTYYSRLIGRFLLPWTVSLSAFDFQQLYNETAPLNLENFQEGKPLYTLSPLDEINALENKDWHAQLSKYLGKKPVVVRGLLYAEKKIFPNAENWNLDMMRKIFEGRDIPIFADQWNDKSVRLCPIDEYLDNLTNPNFTGYAKAITTPGNVFEELTGWDAAGFTDNVMNMPMERKFTFKLTKGKPYVFFVGHPNVKTRMHSDITTSAFFMLQGHKRWIFFDPIYTPYLFPEAHQGNVAFNTAPNVFNYSMEHHFKFPFLSKVKGSEVFLNPGDLLFFPSFWWHAVENLDITLAMDLPIVDVLGSAKRNFPLLVSTSLHPKAVLGSLDAFLTPGGLGIKETFFRGYFESDKDLQKYKEMNAKHAKSP